MPDESPPDIRQIDRKTAKKTNRDPRLTQLQEMLKHIHSKNQTALDNALEQIERDENEGDGA